MEECQSYIFVSGNRSNLVSIEMIGIIVRSLMEEIIDKDSGVAFMREEWFGIVAVAIVLAYLILKKDISELKIVSLFLFFGVIGFVCLLIAHYFLEEDRGR